MKRALLTAAAVALGLGLAACETATPYVPAPPGPAAAAYGYRDTKIDSTHWRVSFSGNSLTSRETVEKYLLYRAAELTLQQGFDWFEETGAYTEERTRYYLNDRPAAGDAVQSEYRWRLRWSDHGPVAGWRFWRREGRSPPDSDNAFTTQRYIATAEIVAGNGPPPQGRRVLDAHRLTAELGPGIERPPG